MILYPAIDLKDGRCVRLRQGEAAQTTDYGDPVEAARSWERAGAEWLHLVDLDGAFEGAGANLEVVARIVAMGKAKTQLGGGIRTMEDIRIRLEEVCVTRVILGTVALEQPELVREACAAYPGRIAVGIDARQGKVAVRGWTAQSDRDALELAQEMKRAGVSVLIYTDIGRDGMLSGPNIEETARMVRQSGLKVIASGGVSTLMDLCDIQAAGCAGAIIGKALYSGQFTLEEALGQFAHLSATPLL